MAELGEYQVRNFHEMLPEEIIEPAWLEDYEKYIEAIHRRLVRLNCCLVMLEKIMSFPFSLFRPKPEDNIFWDLVEYTFVQDCILIIWQVAVDTDKEGLTVRQLKNKICQHLKKEEYCSLFKALEKRCLEDKEKISDIEKKIREIRHNYVAHYNFEKNVNPTAEQIEQRMLLLSDLKTYQKILNKYFSLLCFGCQRGLTPFGLDTNEIEKLLDNVAKESNLLDLPEENPGLWQSIRHKSSEVEIQAINEYRSKFNLPPA